ncbi:NUDIX domain-containing protein [Nonomuraea sp. K274]|uniref:NUDIX domain-containing protein n=1 Tax=Nonomuraea cypriaca TaxID=1187855 RepID=A0A931AIW1_9ACTN|nr:NUDIX domain-containing protein [Nonomuraea cypriaca]MBF8192748.1 NUDIX domain-containing protein [Nonomuraea cypriaca]
MTISQAEIRRTIERYLKKYPDEWEGLEPLLVTLNARDAFWSRSTFPIHVTCSAAVVDDTGMILMIKHRALDKWLLPGGHVESRDLNLVSASLRELKEETDIGSQFAVSPQGLDDTPIDIDIHDIPANPKKAEPAHRHADLRFVFRTRYPRVEVQVEEISAYAWRSPMDLHTPRLVEKLTEQAKVSYFL